jgi:hypothetical protein
MSLFVPQTETPEGWRKTLLGAIACLLGWHFGQIAVSEPLEYPYQVECARCKRIYAKH